MSGRILVVIGGRPGVGKSAATTEIARLLAMRLISIDGIADRLIEVHGFAAITPRVVYAQARADVVAANRTCRRIVVDGVNPDTSTRLQWRVIGARHFDRFVDVEIRCSRPDVWARRMERRVSRFKHIAAPDWPASRNYRYEERTDDRLIFDSATLDAAAIARGIVSSLGEAAVCDPSATPTIPRVDRPQD